MPLGDDILGDGVLGDGILGNGAQEEAPPDGGGQPAAPGVRRHEDMLRLLFHIDPGGVFADDIAIEGAHLDDLQAAVDSLGGEIFPDSAFETLADWERLYDITPASDATPGQRRSVAAQHKRARGGLSRAYFISLAAAMGYEIEIEELPPGSPGYDEESRYIWRVHVASSSRPAIYFTAGDSGAGDELATWPPETALEDLFERLKPAHSQVLFVYE